MPEVEFLNRSGAVSHVPVCREERPALSVRSAALRSAAMCDAALLDLVHGCPTCARAALRDEPAGDAHVFLLCGKRSRDTSRFPGTRVHVLDRGSTAECLYRFKQSVDALDLSAVRVITTPHGRRALLQYQELLFTALYSFSYRLSSCPDCEDSAHADSPDGVREDVTALVQQLPTLRGNIRVLQSALIPECFGHGFTTRTGGVSYVPTLSSMNLFASDKRRDPEAVVMENWRRLALHAGFHHLPLRLVKVSHGRDVWVLGKDEPKNYDAMVTDQTGVVLAAPGADCMTILFTDPRSKVIAVAHAGWRGTLQGVAMATVETMVTEFGCCVSDIVVAVGPSVGPCCFALKPQEAQEFRRIHPDCVPDPESPSPHVNIRLANRVLLERGGVLPEHIHDDTASQHRRLTFCSSCHPHDFFSHNRDGPDFGTQVGFLWIREAAAGRGGD